MRLIARALVMGLLLVAALAAQAQSSDGPPSKADPLEPLNRAVFAFNDTLDSALFKPVAQGYEAVVPSLVRAGVDNFFSNLGGLWTTLNLLLQGKPQAAMESGWRFLANATFGLGGLLDVASEMNIERRSEDFGQTLGWWGVPPGPYLVLPFLGPSTLRDTAALTADFSAPSTALLLRERADRNAATALRAVNGRANLLGVGNALDDIALDKYTLFRDGFLARRRNQVYDGDPPDEEAPAPSK